jgi:hypothetical protein
MPIFSLGHDKSDTTARYTHVATGKIANVESPLVIDANIRILEVGAQPLEGDQRRRASFSSER